ncbi:MAG: autotransporter-associated beta strand repeat-containing protein [Acetobacter sp.]|uniref:autotransporter-associated beta strand repeat-containing protein n=1 Tax=Acetobacter sp. TaxID=440 RepID=UPI0039E8663F
MDILSENPKSSHGYYHVAVKVGFLAALLCGVASQALSPAHAQSASNTVTFSPDAATTSTSSDPITDNGSAPVSVIMNGTGTQILTGENTYTGATTIDGGTLALAGTGSIAQSSGVHDNTAFDISGVTTGSIAIQSLDGAGAVALGGNALSITNGNSTFGNTYAGAMSGTGALVVMGGSETLTGDNTYTGATVAAAGADLTISDGGQLDGTAVIDNEGHMVLDNGHITMSGLAIGSTDSLTLQNKSSIAAPNAMLVGGSDPASTSTSTITIDDSTVDVARLIGAETGTGTVSITNGSVVTADLVATADANSRNPIAEHGTGSIDVTGSGSELNIGNGGLYVNVAGSGSVSVEDGATISSAGQVSFGSSPSVVAPGSVGTLTVGQGGTLAVGGTDGIINNEGSAGSYQFNLAGGTLKDIGSDLTTSVNATLVDGTTSTVDTNGLNTTLSGTLSGDGSLTKVSNGTLVLTGANTYTGATTISGGTLALGGAGSIASSAGVHDNATFDISGVTPASASIQSLDGTGSVTLGDKTLDITNGNATFGNTFSGVASGSGGLTVSGGTETLSGANTYTGNTIVAANTGLTVSGGGTLNGTNSVQNDGNVVLDNGHVTVTSQNDGQHWDGVVASGFSDGSNANMTLQNGSTLDVKQGTLTVGFGKNSQGTVTVDDSTANAAILVLGENGTGSLNVKNGGVVSADVAVVGNQTDGTGHIDVTDAGSQLNVGTAGLYVNADGSGTVSVENGGVISSAGQVSFGDGSTVASGSTGELTLGQNGTLEVGGTDGIVANEGGNGSYQFNMAGGTLKDTGSDLTTSVNATLVSGTNSTVDTNGLNTTLSGVLSGDGSLTKVSDGTLTLTNANTYTGSTTIDAGTLALSASGSVSDSSTVDISEGATFDISGTTSGTSVKDIGGAGGINLGGQTLTLTAANPDTVYSGVASGSGGLTVSGGAETLTGSNDYTGNTIVAANTGLTVSGGGTLNGTNSVQNDGNVVLDNGHVTVTSQNDGQHWDGVVASGFSDGSNANMTLQNGSTLDVKQGTLTVGLGKNSQGSVTVDDSTANAAILILGENGTGSLNVKNGGVVNAALAGIGNQTDGTGHIDVTDASSQLNVGSYGLYVNADGSGTVSVENGGVISSAGQVSFGDGGTVASGSTGTLTLGQNGTLEVGGTDGIVANEGSNGSYQFNMAGGTLKDVGADLTTSVNATLISGTNSTVDTNGLNTTLSGVLSGDGSLTKVSDGTLTLTNANTYAGTTSVTAGTLQVDGSTGTGDTTVASGATLSGTGTVSGNATISSGAILSAGDGANGLGTLTVAKDLTLETGSIQNFQTGQANVSGGQYNDLVVVKGNLTLGGTLNVAANTDGPDAVSGGLDAGVYRIYTYDGGLTNNGETLGTVDAASGVQLGLQTSINHQVNLVVNDGNLNFWDGGNTGTNHGSDGSSGDGKVNGGDGIWTAMNGAGDNNWTNENGSRNAPWYAGGFAVFEGSAGTVTVSDKDTNGNPANVTFSGMQFANNDGGTYVITGDDLYATTSSTTIRVGDGTSAGAAITAQLDTVINDSDVAGGTSLVKSDAGTLVVTKDQTYRGATTISGGTLQLGNGGTAGDIATSTAIHDNGTLAVDRSDAITVGQVIDGTGNLNQIGTGTTTLTGANTYTGDTTISGGTLALSGTGTIALSAGVHDNAAFDISGVTPGSSSIQSLDGTGSVALGGKTLDITNGNATFGNTFSGVASGTGSVTVSGGTETLSGANTYTGDTSVASGAGLDLPGSVAGKLTTAGTTDVDGGTVGGVTTNTGTFTAENGKLADVSNNGGTATLSDTTAGAVTNALGATFSATGGTIASAANSGTMTLGTGTEVTGGVTNSAGSLTLDGSMVGGTVAATGGTFDVASLGSHAGSLSGSAAGTLDGTLNLTNASDTYSGGMSGTGGVTVSGGTETLTGANIYTGDTTISGGTLQLGDGGTTGSLSRTSAIHDDGQLTIDHANTLAMTQTIDGTGSFTQAGTGRTILSGMNTYSGGTAVTGGALVGTTSSFGSGRIVDEAALEVSQNTSGILTNTIYGKGSFTKSGTGTVGIEGDDSAFTGTTEVAEGTLDVGGSLSGSTVTVNNGATLSGTGMVGSTHVADGGILSPGGGGKIGTLTTNGSLTMDSGSTLLADGTGIDTGRSVTVNGVTGDVLQGDKVQVNGALNLTGGTVALDVANGGTLKYGQVYQLVSATDGVSGQYDKLVTNLANPYTFLAPSLVYDADSVNVMDTRNGVAFASVANTRNEIAAGGALDRLPTNNPVSTAVSQLDAQGARKAFNALSGEVHASARTALIQDSFFVRQAALDRLDNADCDSASADSTIRTADLRTKRDDGRCHSDRAMLWGEAYGSLGHNSGDGDAASMQHSTAGFVMGADAPVMETWRVGGLVSYGRSMFDIGSGRSSSGHSNNVSVGGYAGTHWGNLNLRLGATYTWDMLSIRRNVAVPGLGNRLTSNYMGGTAQGFGELSYKLHAGKTIVEPFGNVAYVNLHTDGYHEHGGASALNGKATDTGVTFSTFGLRASSAVQVGKLTLVPHGMVAYRHAFGLTTPTLRQVFAGTSGAGMDIAGVALSTNAVVLDTGLTLRLTDRIDVGLSYIGQYGDQSVDSGARAHFRFKF